ncbi:SusE domain-containing protein [Psychroserpens mesophilus]|uniref:SusE domain-containing protein n=1 Tax=Psychroserpens mesophilus TaxID=325473 RepID=UPI003F497254
MKNLKFILLTCIAVLSFTACQQDDDLEFVATEATDLAFTTTFLSNYVLNSTVSENLAERFTWDDANFGVATNVTYSLQAATLEDFSDYIAGDDLYNIGNTSGNEIPVTVGEMIDLAEVAGLDNDPATEASNIGVLYFRLMAVVGDDGLPTMSEIQALNVELQEQSIVVETGECEVDILYGVGAGLPAAGWDWGTPVELMCTQDGVWSGNVEFQNTVDNNNFRFFTESGEWASGRNYPWYVAEGYTIDSNLVDAMDGDNNFAFVGTNGTYLLTIDTNNLEITLGTPNAEGTCEFDVLYGVGAGLVDTGWDWANPAQFVCTSDGVWSGSVALQNNGGADNNFRFFTILDEWASGRNYPYYVDAGYTIDSELVNAEDGDFNFAFVGTTGTYTITIDTNNLTITLD